MSLPEMTTITINMPLHLLKAIEEFGSQRMINRSACIRLLVQDALTDPAATSSPPDNIKTICRNREIPQK